MKTIHALFMTILMLGAAAIARADFDGRYYTNTNEYATQVEAYASFALYWENSSPFGSDYGSLGVSGTMSRYVASGETVDLYEECKAYLGAAEYNDGYGGINYYQFIYDSSLSIISETPVE